MRFFLDENFPRSAIPTLNAQGHQTVDWREVAARGTADNQIFDLAQQHQATLLTTDRDFFHTIPHLHKHHCGILVVALSKPNRKNLLDRLLWALSYFDSSTFRDRAIQLRDHSWTAYPPLK